MEVWHDGSQNHYPLQQESFLKRHKYSEGNDKSSVIGTANPSGVPESTSDFSAVRVVFCVLFYRSLLILLCGLFCFIGSASVHVFSSFIYVLPLPIQLSRGMGFDPLSGWIRHICCCGQNWGCPSFTESNLLILVWWHNTQRTTHIKN